MLLINCKYLNTEFVQILNASFRHYSQGFVLAAYATEDLCGGNISLRGISKWEVVFVKMSSENKSYMQKSQCCIEPHGGVLP